MIIITTILVFPNYAIVSWNKGFVGTFPYLYFRFDDLVTLIIQLDFSIPEEV